MSICVGTLKASDFHDTIQVGSLQLLAEHVKMTFDALEKAWRGALVLPC